MVCLLWVAACSDKVPPLDKLPEDAVVVAFGDSLTYGTGAKDDETYPYYLSQIIQREVINAGNPGELSAEGRQRLPQVLDEHQPDLLILCHGGNDLLRKKSRENLVANLKAMIGQAKQRGIQVMLVGVPEPALFLLESAPFYAKIAHSENIPLEQAALPAIESDDTLKSDPIHPNAAGYRKLAHAIARLLQAAGAV
ncbi:MAG: GDSL-type esterase/lipase family protein [Gammaproteobacteria bacterium]|jgi:lysophospholipase L1-like esterase